MCQTLFFKIEVSKILWRWIGGVTASYRRLIGDKSRTSCISHDFSQDNFFSVDLHSLFFQFSCSWFTLCCLDYKSKMYFSYLLIILTTYLILMSEICIAFYLPRETRPICKQYGNTGCGLFKRGVQNQKDFCLRINILKGNY